MLKPSCAGSLTGIVRLMRRIMPGRICSCAFAVAAISAFFVAVSLSRPPVSLSVLGFQTNTLSASETGLGTNVEYVCAVIRMTNSGVRPVMFTADLDTPGYTTLRKSGTGWSTWTSFMCGLAAQERSLLPGQSLTFRAIVETEIPCRIAVPYRTSNLKGKVRDFLPTWLLLRVPWVCREPTVTTPVIRVKDGKYA